MGQITSGVGLISGLPIADLVDQLISIESRPKQLVERQLAVLTSQQVAFNGVNAQLLSLKSAAESLTQTTTFNATTATSSNEDILAVSSTNRATPGTFTFLVDSLVSTQQTITGGFVDTDKTPLAAGTLSFEFGNAKLRANTKLSEVNGGQNIVRGNIRVTDRAGNAAIVDLSRALTVNDVLDAINQTEGVDVTASVEGGAFKLTDTSGGAGSLAISEVAGGTTAASLGLLSDTDVDAATFTGNSIHNVAASTFLTTLNDGLGVDISDSAADFRVDINGTTFNVNLHLTTNALQNATPKVGDVLDAINSAANTAGFGDIASINADGSGIALDTGVGTDTITVQALGSRAAFDLGIQTTSTTGRIEGDRILATLNTRLVRNLNGGRAALTDATTVASLRDGAGLSLTGDANADLTVTDRTGAVHSLDLDGLTTVADLRSAVATQSGGVLSLSIEKNALTLTDSSGGAGDLIIANGAGSQAATQLGLTGTFGADSAAGTALRAQRSLGATRQVSFTNSAGVATTLDFSSDKTVQNIIDRINTEATGFTAALNANATGLTLTDTAAGAGSTVINDVGATAGENAGFAAELGIAGTHTTSTIDAENLQLNYIADSTRLAKLNGGRGVAPGSFTITDSAGSTQTINLAQGELTIGEVIDEINSRFAANTVVARVNDQGDGILVEDRGPGTVAMKIEEQGATTAADLGIKGEAANPGDSIDGSFERTITIEDISLITDTTELASLNGGDGVRNRDGLSDFTITNRDGDSFNINLDGDTTIADLKASIDTASGSTVELRINTAGTGFDLVDLTSGSGALTVETLNNSNAAADLGIDGDAADGTITGEEVIEIVTLDTLAAKINDAGFGVRASVINLNDGSPTPYRLSLTSTTEGEAGAFIFNDGDLNFGATTLTEGKNATVFFGSGDPAKALAVSSTTNTLNTIPGATVTLNGVSDQPVSITINRDEASIVSAVQGFVDTFNEVLERFDQLDSFDSETNERSLLFGDYTITRIRASLFAQVNGRNNDLSGSFNALSQVGIRVGSGTRLEFNEERFRNALATDRTAVQQLFTFKEQERDEDSNEITTTASGIGVDIAELLARMTDSIDGTVQRRIDSIDGQLTGLRNRIEQQDVLLDAKRARLEADFANLESVLAQLQTQSSALASFQPVAPNSLSLS